MESLFLTLSTGSHMDSSGIWGIARVTVKVIAGVIYSAIYACCECNYSQIVQEFI